MYYEIYRDRSGYWRWRLKAANHRIIADSAESYFNKTDCLHAIDLVSSSRTAKIYEV